MQAGRCWVAFYTARSHVRDYYCGRRLYGRYRRDAVISPTTLHVAHDISASPIFTVPVPLYLYVSLPHLFFILLQNMVLYIHTLRTAARFALLASRRTCTRVLARALFAHARSNIAVALSRHGWLSRRSDMMVRRDIPYAGGGATARRAYARHAPCAAWRWRAAPSRRAYARTHAAFALPTYYTIYRRSTRTRQRRMHAPAALPQSGGYLNIFDSTWTQHPPRRTLRACTG